MSSVQFHCCLLSTLLQSYVKNTGKMSTCKTFYTPDSLHGFSSPKLVSCDYDYFRVCLMWLILVCCSLTQEQSGLYLYKNIQTHTKTYKNTQTHTNIRRLMHVLHRSLFLKDFYCLY